MLNQVVIIAANQREDILFFLASMDSLLILFDNNSC